MNNIAGKFGKISYANSQVDKRTRTYVPPQRVVCSSEGELSPENVDVLLNQVHVQTYLAFNPPFCRLKPGSFIILDYGCEMHGGVRLVIGESAFKRSKVRVRFGESVSECLNEPNNDHAIHEMDLDVPMLGMAEIGNTAFRFVRIDVDKEQEHCLDLISLLAVALYHDLEYVGSFNSSDERLNKIWQTGAYTVHLNMQDYIYDGVKRDRLVWMGDMYPEVRVIAATFDEVDIVKRSMDFMRDTTPDKEWMNGFSSYSAWWVICQHDWYLLRGDEKYLKQQQRMLNHTLAKLASEVDENGVEHLTGCRFLDWPTADNDAVKHAGLQGLLAWTFNCGEALGAYLKDADMVELCRKTRQRLAKYVPDCCNNKTAAAMQLLGKLADAKTLNDTILSQKPYENISTFYGYFVLQARAAANDVDGAVDLISRYWGAMLDYGATTFWEDFDLNWLKNTSRIDEIPVKGKDDLHADFGNYCYKGLRHSLCHGWAGGPTAFLSEHVLGVKSLAPGMREIKIQPQLGKLSFVNGTFPTPFGPVKVEAVQKNGVTKFEYQAPAEIKVRS